MLLVLNLYLLLAAGFDFFTLRIPNRLTLGLLPVLMIYRIYLDSWSAIPDILATLLLVPLVLFYPFYRQGIGAADIKFLINVGILTGTVKLINCFLWGAITALPVLAYLALKHKERIKFFFVSGEILDSKKAPRIPYVVFLALGTFIYMNFFSESWS